MIRIQAFTFNDFQENTYVVFDNTGQCMIIDPGCSNREERRELQDFIEKNELKAARLINTHCHIDHVFGNAFIAETYDLKLEAHHGEKSTLEAGPMIAQMYGLSYEPSPPIESFIEDGEIVHFGESRCRALLTPGHSPASLSFYFEESGALLAGDVLFRESIGRTDLPGGNFQTLITSIREKVLSLPDDVRVLPGHGPETTIGHERQHNPFLTGQV